MAKNKNRNNTQTPTVEAVEEPVVLTGNLIEEPPEVKEAIQPSTPLVDPKYEVIPGKPIVMNYMGVDITVEPKQADGSANPAYAKILKQLEDQVDAALADDRFMLEGMLMGRMKTMLVDIQRTLDTEHGEGVKDINLLLAGWAIGVWFNSRGVEKVAFGEGKKLEVRERAKRSDAGSNKE